MPDRDDIPRIFYSEYTELPFAKCIDCECDLFESETVYTVVKHIVGKETVFEMAICMSCAMKMREQYSEETSRNIQAYIETKLREKLLARIQALEESDQEESELEEEEEFTVEDGLAACSFCGADRASTHRYEMVGLFQENELLLDSGQGISFSSPMMLCQECNSEVGKLISKQTRDTWDRFIEEHFDGPPGIEIDGPKVEPLLF
ncbi:hypothetical protein [Thalassoglobus sp.]|uniref:hypothetical protein n=1 Tax=Thalassoglobus sp. TaxID=2795869 RepID=UPI003AA855DD